ncbi:MAG: heme NO-binding domain-containing protein [Actinomycetota bacterium]|nr:heme NO-binding domain-containing protein [Actinomycetota bacterium]
MHGVVFSSFRDYVTATYGRDVTQQVFAGSGAYLLSEAYPDEEFVGLVSRAVEVTQTDAEELVHDFGVFTAQTTFARLYPAFFAISPTARDFLLTVETRIHELVRATIPNAQPPQLHVSERGEDGVSIVYTSPRRLCVLLRGLVEGTARHYGETAAITESTCAKHGDDACTFEITLRSAPTA